MTRQDLPLMRRWIAARVRFTLRTPRATFFTFVFPLMFLVIFNALNGDASVAAMGDAGGEVPFAQFYTPSIGIFGLTLACYTSVIFGLATARDIGLLKRIQGTPLPMPIYLGSWLTGAVLTGLASVVLMFAVAIPVFGVDIYPRMLPAAIVTLILGAATLAALGLAVASLVRTADQAMPVAQLTFLPLSFISGIWYPLDGAPGWITTIAHIFPLYHLVNAFDACFVPQTTGGGWSWNDLGRARAVAGGGDVGGGPALPRRARRRRAEPAARALQCVTRRRPGLTGSGTDLRPRLRAQVAQALVAAQPVRRRLGVGQRDAAGRRRLGPAAETVVAAASAFVLLGRAAAVARLRAQEHDEQHDAQDECHQVQRAEDDHQLLVGSHVCEGTLGRPSPDPVSLPSPAALWLPPTPARSR